MIYSNGPKPIRYHKESNLLVPYSLSEIPAFAFLSPLMTVPRRTLIRLLTILFGFEPFGPLPYSIPSLVPVNDPYSTTSAASVPCGSAFYHHLPHPVKQIFSSCPSQNDSNRTMALCITKHMRFSQNSRYFTVCFFGALLK